MKQYGIKILDGNESAGKVLTSDSDGRGTWQVPTGGGGGASFAATFTPGVAGSPNTITHGLSTTDINVTLIDLSTGEIMLPNKIDNITTNTVDITFSENPAGDVRVIVLASGGSGGGTPENENAEYLVFYKDSNVALDTPETSLFQIILENRDNIASLGGPGLNSITSHVSVTGNTFLTSVSFPVLSSVGPSFAIYSNPILSTIDLVSLSTVGDGFSISRNPSLTAIIIGNAFGGSIYFNNNALAQSGPGSVDDILAKLDTAGFSGGILMLQGGTSATPSPAGVTSKNNLIGKGWSVTTN